MQRHTRHTQPAYTGRRSRSELRERSSAPAAARRTWLPGSMSAMLTRILHSVSRRRTNRSGRFAGTAIILLVLAGSCLCLAGAGRAAVGHAQRSVRLAEEKGNERLAGNLPAEGHWIDTADGTAYMLQLQPNAKGYSTFDFTLPAGQQLEGLLPLATLADGTLAQGTSVIPRVTTSLPPSTTPRCQDGVLQSDSGGQVPITYTFLAHVSADGLGAFATLSYYATNQFRPAVAVICGAVPGVAGVTTYQLSAGCTLTSCTDLASLTGPTVANFDTALLSAEQNKNGTGIYNLTSRQVTAQYSQADFAALFNQQLASVGQITSISTPLASPVVEFTPEGQAYFAVTQTVTVQHSGATHMRTLTSYYILENGTWLFWFSG